MKIGFIIPVFNDWESLSILINNIVRIKNQFNDTDEFELIIVNDFSTEDHKIKLLKKGVNFKIIQLYQNVGHQRAIAFGLCYANEFFNGDSVIVMDADGEDKPEDIPVLINHFKEKKIIVFASRKKRYESVLFKLFYFIYKIIFKMLTGEKISFGNYSIIPKDLLDKIIRIPEIWNHYSGAIIKSKLPYFTIPLNRGKRYEGTSKMNLSTLIVHGFSTFSIYSEIISARVVLFTLILLVLNISLILIVLYRKFIIHIASPGWATTAILGLTIISMLSLLFSFVIGLLVLSTRNQGLNNPSKNYREFISKIEEI